jgi:hypothetical protein
MSHFKALFNNLVSNKLFCIKSKVIVESKFGIHLNYKLKIFLRSNIDRQLMSNIQITIFSDYLNQIYSLDFSITTKLDRVEKT